MTGLGQTLTALADPTRRGVVDLLRRRPHRPGELAEALDITAPALSKHLRVLRRHGLITEERLETDARVRLLRLRQEPFLELQRWLNEIESFWSEQLESRKTRSEGEQPGDPR